MMMSCCGGSCVNNVDVYPFRWIEKEVCGDTDENLACLLLVPATTTPAGVVPLLGGVVEVCAMKRKGNERKKKADIRSYA
jgi:hypothetical protein